MFSSESYQQQRPHLCNPTADMEELNMISCPGSELSDHVGVISLSISLR